VSREDREVIQRAVTAFNGRDVDTFVAATTKDFEWVPSMSPIEAQRFLGAPGIRKYFESLGSDWDEFRIVPSDLRSHREGLLVLGRLEACGKNSGARVESPLGMAFDLRDGMISRIRGYLDHAAALKAVGLQD
jgi:ketosteroid isomerase-like protein